MINAWILFHSDPSNAEHESEECTRLLEEGYKLGVSFKILDQSQFELLVDDKGLWQAYYNGQKLEEPEFILVRSGAETNYAGFAVLRFYEQLGVPLYNPRRAIERSADKLYAQKILGTAGIAMPKSLLGRCPPDIDLVERELGFPVVLKVLNGTCGQGIMLANDREQLRDVMGLLAQTGGDIRILFQQYITASHGRDLRVLVTGGKVQGCMERRSTGGFKSNVSLGGVGSEHPVTSEIEKLALAAASALELDVAGVDLLMDENGYKVCEVNSAPGFTGEGGMEAACRLNVAKLIIEAALAQHRRSRGKTMWGRLRGLFETGVAA